MSDAYTVPAESKEVELLIKKSRFLGILHRVENRITAENYLKGVRKTHPKANHHCYGFIAGSPYSTQNFGFSDDGEPSGTAGKPILNVLQHSGIGEILVVVVRYFGGIKLGTGGLVSAYSDTTNEVLKELKVCTIEERFRYALNFSYSSEPIVRNVLSKYETIPESSYAETVRFELFLTENERSSIDQDLVQLNLKCLRVESKRRS